MWVKITNGTNTGKVTNEVWDKVQKQQKCSHGVLLFNLEVYDPGDRFSDLMRCEAGEGHKHWRVAKDTDPLK